MNKVEVISKNSQNQQPITFPEEWVDSSYHEHFWFKWRFEVLCDELKFLKVSLKEPLRLLDVGCSKGVVSEQLAKVSSFTVDGADLDIGALRKNKSKKGRLFFYDINERHPEFSEKYDIAILFDILEHIDRPTEFIKASLFHVKPGGLVFINVPALEFLYSSYDIAIGHRRRYSIATLQEILPRGSIQIVDIRYWGYLLIPLAYARKLFVRHKDVLRRGMSCPSGLMNNGMQILMEIEKRILKRPFIGASLFCVIKKI